ncbi:hypothetical protein AC482_03410 [miscellaneous Crenarchaeota group-15 archaeon DG-45]|uniref:ASCH domain-containing protein n=1 Tax=miscellaneous Crenarchaeota group-15 archaeon DG-45 TaxID=1685127 RepID=A0A0M0BPX6_9ARCH|nr:MAG: hypothetical protein AC482_03410 [miscellaneous Crenarchaeota group-15 archaeon DG-45]
MGLIFKKEHIELVLLGVKTQTRRRHKHRLKAGRIYDVKTSWTHRTGHKILITKVYTQRLRDITPEEAAKEGNYTIGEFVYVWMRINGEWNPNEFVVVYEFKVVTQPAHPVRLKGFLW